MQTTSHALSLRRLGISTYKEAVIYLRQDSYICKAEGFEAQSRIQVKIGNKSTIATLNTITSDLLQPDEASLSEWAWETLDAQEGELVYLSHPSPLDSMEYVRAKIYGNKLNNHAFTAIMKDVMAGHLSDIQISAFLSACAHNRLDVDEIAGLTAAMLNVGNKINWHADLVVDKHCIGGLPGNRTTIIVVPIIAACGLTIPKTSSRAITSSAGTADTMETLAPVDLNFAKMRQVVEQERGCIVWGDAASLSPADDIMIRIERSLNLDSQGQMVASVLSKKVAAGSTHVVIDIPIGPTAKIRNMENAELLKGLLEQVSTRLGLHIKVLFSDGTQPIGRGIGPALEAYDVLSILQNCSDAPQDLREHALLLAGEILEFSPSIPAGQGLRLATETLVSGKAWQKFQAICAAQGGMRTPPKACYSYEHVAQREGKVTCIDNRRLALLAKLAGAPRDKAAGVYMHVRTGASIVKSQPLFTVYAEAPGELDYAVSFLKHDNAIVHIE